MHHLCAVDFQSANCWLETRFSHSLVSSGRTCGARSSQKRWKHITVDQKTSKSFVCWHFNITQIIDLQRLLIPQNSNTFFKWFNNGLKLQKIEKVKELCVFSCIKLIKLFPWKQCLNKVSVQTLCSNRTLMDLDSVVRYRFGLSGEPRHGDEPDDICVCFSNKDKPSPLFWQIYPCKDASYELNVSVLSPNRKICTLSTLCSKPFLTVGGRHLVIYKIQV